MEIQLIVSDTCEACNRTRKIWTDACQQLNVQLEIMDLDVAEGRVLVDLLDIKSFPALVINKQVKAVGHPDRFTAIELIKSQF